jgi:ABC-type multidrug transport system fused ATPase/permease subunit
MTIPLRQYWVLLVDYLRPQRRRVVILGVLLFTGIALQLINPQILRYFIDTATSAYTSSTLPYEEWHLTYAALIFICVAMCQQVITVLATYVSENVAWTATNQLRADLARHCLNLDMAYHNEHTPGELIERIDGDVSALANFFSQLVLQVFGNGVLLLGVLVLLFREDWRVGGAMGVFAALALGTLFRVSQVAVPHWENARQASADLFGFLEERLAGTEDIRSNGAKPYVMRGFFELLRSRWSKEMKAGFMVNLIVNSTSLLFTIGNAVAFAVGAYLFLSKQITIGTVFLIFQYSNLLFMPIERISQQIGDLQKAGASITRIQQLRRVTNQVRYREKTNDEPLLTGPLQVAFEHVSFGYEGDDLVLKDIHFQLQPGEVLGLLGRTGSGKTTLARLLFRLYDPNQGAIILGNSHAQIDLRELSKDEFHQRVGMVTQDVQLFNASVRDNLTFFNPAIPDEDILHAIRDLGLWAWFSKLPQGLDTELQAGGNGLSAGEAQLLAFIRIFLTDPGLVILDEASSRLDPLTEQMIEQAVDKLLHGDPAHRRTAIIIAHRLATLHRADNIIVLEKGSVLEYGDRTQLANDPSSRFYSLLRTGLEEMLV